MQGKGNLPSSGGGGGVGGEGGEEGSWWDAGADDVTAEGFNTRVRKGWMQIIYIS